VALDALPSGTTYYWHVRAATGETTGSFSLPFAFVIPAGLLPPVPIQPAEDSVQSPRPALLVTNVPQPVSVTSVMYHFEFASDSTFGTVLQRIDKNRSPVSPTRADVTSDLPNEPIF